MSADNGRPLEEKLIAAFIFVRRVKIVGQIVVLKAQPVKFAQIPSHKRRIADRPLPRALDERSPIEEKPSGPILV